MRGGVSSVGLFLLPITFFRTPLPGDELSSGPEASTLSPSPSSLRQYSACTVECNPVNRITQRAKNSSTGGSEQEKDETSPMHAHEGQVLLQTTGGSDTG